MMDLRLIAESRVGDHVSCIHGASHSARKHFTLLSIDGHSRDAELEAERIAAKRGDVPVGTVYARQRPVPLDTARPGTEVGAETS